MTGWTLGLASLAVGTGCALGVVAANSPGVGTMSEEPKEFGAVAWGRQLEPALASAKESEKPVMLLFQEVPG